MPNDYKKKIASMCNWNLPKKYNFKSVGSCMEALHDLKDLKEGYVCYNAKGIPICKIKSPSYVAAHRLRGECTPTPKRIMDLIFMNEHEEYLAIFSEDKGLFDPYLKAFDRVLEEYLDNLHWCKAIKEQKDFAKYINANCKGVSSLLFKKRKDHTLTFREIFDNLFTKVKYKMVEAYL